MQADSCSGSSNALLARGSRRSQNRSAIFFVFRSRRAAGKSARPSLFLLTPIAPCHSPYSVLMGCPPPSYSYLHMLVSWRVRSTRLANMSDLRTPKSGGTDAVSLESWDCPPAVCAVVALRAVTVAVYWGLQRACKAPCSNQDQGAPKTHQTTTQSHARPTHVGAIALCSLDDA